MQLCLSFDQRDLALPLIFWSNIFSDFGLIDEISHINKASMTFKQGSRPRKRSSVSYPALPQHNRRASFSPGSPLDEDQQKTTYSSYASGSGSGTSSFASSFHASSSSSSSSSSRGRGSNVLKSITTVAFAEKFLKVILMLLVAFFVLIRLFSSESRPYYDHHRNLDSSKVLITFEPRITPNVADIPQLRTSLALMKEKYVPTTFLFDPESKVQFPIVIVTTIDIDKYSTDDIAKIIQNREQYAKIHGFGLYVRYAQDFVGNYFAASAAKTSWAKVYATRAAMTAFPTAEWLWYVDADVLISNMHENIYDRLLSTPKALESLLLRKVPVVMATDYIRSFQNTRAQDIQLIMSQDHIGLNTASFLLRHGDWAEAWLDFWGDQTLSSFPAFDRGDKSGLNHIIQWHVSFLSKLGLVAPDILAHSWQDKPGSTDLQFVTWFNCDFRANACHDKFVEQYQQSSATVQDKHE